MGNCDNGTLTFTVSSDKEGKATVVPTLQSTLIRAASCSISWNYSYLPPSHDIGPEFVGAAEESLLSGCFVSYTTGEEGIEVISYWFYILDWDITMLKEGMKISTKKLKRSLFGMLSAT